MAIGMHPNTEISYRTDQCNALFMSLVDILPRGGEASGDEGEEKEGGGEASGGGNAILDKLNLIKDAVGEG